MKLFFWKIGRLEDCAKGRKVDSKKKSRNEKLRF